MRPDNDSSFRADYKKPYLMLPGRTPTKEDIAQGALDEGTSKDAHVMLAAVLLTPSGEMRLVGIQEYMEGKAPGVVLVFTYFTELTTFLLL